MRTGNDEALKLTIAVISAVIGCLLAIFGGGVRGGGGLFRE